MLRTWDGDAVVSGGELKLDCVCVSLHASMSLSRRFDPMIVSAPFGEWVVYHVTWCPIVNWSWRLRTCVAVCSEYVIATTLIRWSCMLHLENELHIMSPDMLRRWYGDTWLWTWAGDCARVPMQDWRVTYAQYGDLLIMEFDVVVTSCCQQWQDACQYHMYNYNRCKAILWHCC